MTGGSSTSSVAPLLVAVPSEFDATSVNTAPLSARLVEPVEYEEPVAPEMPTPFLRHSSEGAGLPLAAAEKVALEPVATVAAEGWVVIVGAESVRGGGGGGGGGGVEL